MKRVLCVFLIVLLALSLFVGCGKAGDPADGGSSSTTEPVDDGKLHYRDFAKVQIGMSAEECFAILGEPERVDKAYNYYTVMVNGKECELEIWIAYDTQKVTYRYLSCYGSDKAAEFADPNVDFSQVSKLKNKTVTTYEGCKKLFGTEGYIIGEDEKGKTTYLWVSSNGGYLMIHFKSDGKIDSYQGFV